MAPRKAPCQVVGVGPSNGTAHSDVLLVPSFSKILLGGPEVATFIFIRGNLGDSHGVDGKHGKRNGKENMMFNKRPCSAQRGLLGMEVTCALCLLPTVLLPPLPSKCGQALWYPPAQCVPSPAFGTLQGWTPSSTEAV